MSELVVVPREGWHARPPTATEPMANPVPFVITHHSYIPPACHTPEACVQSMQTMQDMHQLQNGWNDIGYSFGVGGDGNAYEGRGWSKVGAHAPKYNNISIGICVIGDWTKELPPENQLNTVHKLIAFGVEKGYIREDYKLLGHRQVRDTECPGDRLFEEISTWEHFGVKGERRQENNGVEDNKLFFFKHKS
nr:PREDICTED: peptidoglycan-recognition protein LB isoform X2 [Tribolium castaneum]|eukprot:XP_008194895.1 PREDICTED: peptidoglycan-recognition protein LB isoform X2 [Tribolium castaneum]